MENLMKVCSKCKVNQELNNFSKQKEGKHGVISKCKSCQKEYRAQCFNIEKSKNYNEVYFKSTKGKDSKKKYAQSKKGLDGRNRTYKKLTDGIIIDNLKKQGYLQELINNPEIIEVKRLIIKTKRLCKTSQN